MTKATTRTTRPLPALSAQKATHATGLKVPCLALPTNSHLEDPKTAQSRPTGQSPTKEFWWSVRAENSATTHLPFRASPLSVDLATSAMAPMNPAVIMASGP